MEVACGPLRPVSCDEVGDEIGLSSRMECHIEWELVGEKKFTLSTIYLLVR